MENNKSINAGFAGSPKRYLIPEKIKTITSDFDYIKIWKFFFLKGIEIYGKKFKFYEEDTDIILKLITWFLKDDKNAKTLSMDLEKGILLVGPVGCGKTSLMNLMRFILPLDQRHRLHSCRDISFEFSRDGYTVIHRYSKGSFSVSKFEPITYCFDDLGLESEMQHYGNSCKVMSEILYSRYDYFHSFGMQTHLTTNLNSTEIEKIYGLRLRSRMREIFNLLVFLQILQIKESDSIFLLALFPKINFLIICLLTANLISSSSQLATRYE